MENSDLNKWTKSETETAFWYTCITKTWYKKKPYFERDMIEFRIDISDMSHATLDYKGYFWIEISDIDFLQAETVRKKFLKRVHDILSIIPINI